MSRAKKRFWSKRSRGPKRGRSQQRGAGEEGASKELTRKEERKEGRTQNLGSEEAKRRGIED